MWNMVFNLVNKATWGNVYKPNETISIPLLKYRSSRPYETLLTYTLLIWSER